MKKSDPRLADLYIRVASSDAKIKAEALQEFVRFVYARTFWRRVRIAVKLVFKRVNL